jgi:hypothetical protein
MISPGPSHRRAGSSTRHVQPGRELPHGFDTTKLSPPSAIPGAIRPSDTLHGVFRTAGNTDCPYGILEVAWYSTVRLRPGVACAGVRDRGRKRPWLAIEIFWYSSGTRGAGRPGDDGKHTQIGGKNQKTRNRQTRRRHLQTQRITLRILDQTLPPLFYRRACQTPSRSTRVLGADPGCDHDKAPPDRKTGRLSSSPPLDD